MAATTVTTGGTGLLGDGAVYAVIGDADKMQASTTYVAATASGMMPEGMR